jgi:hypothetical protein
MALQETLDAFVKSGKKGDLGELMMVLHEIARTGETSYNWPSVRSLLSTQLQNVIDSYSKISPKIVDVDGESFETRYTRVQKYLSDFSRPPFTLQRMAELLVMPRRYYTTGAKFFLAFSKLVCGISARNFEEENRDSPSEVDSKSGMGFDDVVRPPFLEAKVDIDLPIEARALSRLPPGGAQLAQSGGSAGGPAAGGSSGDAPKTVQASESVKPEKSEVVAPVSSSVSASASPAATPSSVSSASSVSSSLIDDNDLNMIS